MPDITLNVSGPASMTPIGVSITYAVNAIPVCLIDLDPTDSDILLSSDQNKRKPVSVSCTVKCDTGLPTATTHTLQFSGLYDGLSPSQSVGSVGYSAVVKGNMQILLEAYTKIPGLSAMGLNPYIRVNSYTSNVQTSDATGWLGLQQNILNIPANPEQDAMSYYLTVVRGVLALQTGGTYAGLVTSDVVTSDLLKMLLTPKVIQNASNALNLVTNNINTDAIAGVADQAQGSIVASNTGIGNRVVDLYVQGPDTIWENMLNFYRIFGCNLICSNTNIYVVPDNGFITFNHPAYSPQLTGLVNTAMPADYSSYSYNDVGYKDIGGVVLLTENDSSATGLPPFTPSDYGGSYPGPANIPGSAIIILDNHPFAYMTDDSALAVDNYRGRLVAMTSQMQSNYLTKKSFLGANTKPGQTNQLSGNTRDQIKQAADNYAQVKYYQLKYGDRMGQIVMTFNPNWVPGTCGTLYIKIGANAGTYIDFLVQSVTHRIAVSAPTNGTAMTVVTFSCGRISASAITVPADLFFNYDSGKMTAVQNNFISDIT